MKKSKKIPKEKQKLSLLQINVNGKKKILSEKIDWKKIEKNNATITLSGHAYVSKHNSSREKQVALLMIPNWEGWHDLAVKKPSVLLRGITSKHLIDFYWLNCLHSLATENKRDSHKKVCENKW